MMNNKRTYIKINKNNLKSNFDILRSLVSNSRIIPVIKADAYGHGAVKIAEILEESGADIFAVAEFGEAKILRDGGIRSEILILGHTDHVFADEIARLDLIQTVHDFEYAKKISDNLTCNKKLSVHMKVDTGMHRIGVDYLQAADDYKKIDFLPNLKLCGAFSHFCESDDLSSNMTDIQLERFLEFTKKVSCPMCHISNSAASITKQDALLDAVRPGIILYGAYPSEGIKKYCMEKGLNFKPVMTFCSRIAQIKTLRAGEGISYNRRYIAKSDMIIATVSAGYADGVPRLLSNRGYVTVRNKQCPIVGNVCMDQLMIDVTNIANKVSVGDEVVFWGDGGIDIDDYAKMCSTINYELLVGISSRVTKIYI